MVDNTALQQLWRWAIWDSLTIPLHTMLELEQRYWDERGGRPEGIDICPPRWRALLEAVS